MGLRMCERLHGLRSANDRDDLRLLLLDQPRKLHAVEETVDRVVQLLPELVRHAFAVAVAILAPAALRGIQGLFHRADDVGNGNLRGIAREVVAPARAADAFHQLAAAQLAEELLK